MSLIHARIIVDDKPLETWLCASRDFKRRGDSKVAPDAYYQAEHLPGESPMDFCIRHGWEKTIYEMLIVGYSSRAKSFNERKAEQEPTTTQSIARGRTVYKLRTEA